MVYKQVETSRPENAERILREGWDLFQQKGYRGVSIAELCRRCELTKPTLYYYFHDKENLFVEVLTHRLRGFHAVIEQGGTLRERLRRITLAMLESFRTSLSPLLRDLEHMRKPASRRRIDQAYRAEFLHPLGALMQAGMGAHELAKGDPEFYTWLFLGLVSAFLDRQQKLSLEREALADRLVTFFLQGAK